MPSSSTYGSARRNRSPTTRGFLLDRENVKGTVSTVARVIERAKVAGEAVRTTTAFVISDNASFQDYAASFE